MKKKYLFLTIIFSLFFCLIQSSHTQAKKKFSLLKNKKFKIIPVPIIEQSPDEAQSYGIMPVIIGSEKDENRIKMILGTIFEYNTVSHFGIGALAQIFPNPHQKIEFFSLVSQDYQRKVRFRFYDYHLSDKYYIDFNFLYHNNPFGRFYGFGAATADHDESNFTSANFFLDPEFGIYLNEVVRFNITPSVHKRKLSDRAINDVDNTLDAYGNLSEVRNAFNFIPKISLVFDTRPAQENSRSGFYSEFAYFFSHENLGSDDNFQGISYEGKLLFPTIKDKIFTALRLKIEKRFGNNIPFYEQSSLGGGNELKSFVPLRFVDKGKIIFQIEERILLKHMKVLDKEFDIFLDPFFEIGRVFEESSDLDFNRWQPVGGIGLRLFVPPNVVGRLDMSIGTNGFEIYTGLGYPF